MEINSAQQEMRLVFQRGSVGQMVSGLIWLVSASLATWVSARYGILMLVLGGMLIFPLTQLTLRVLGCSAGLPNKHPLNQLAMQVAFIVPLSLPLIGAASLYNINWFYPAFMLVVGIHYMPFIFLYGMQEFAVLAAVLISGSVAIALLLPHTFSTGGWLTGIVLVVFALVVKITPRLQRLSTTTGIT